ncbi:MAG: hypothetical protein SGI74_10605 [Oligoflexia bacterium]|nr:hypothetical protein [Oligoflexia bacterium]
MPARIGDIVFGQPVTLSNLTTLEACSQFLIPPVYKNQVISLRQHIERHKKPITNEVLSEYDFELIDLHQEFYEMVVNPQMPRLCNTDGDPLVPQKLIYEIDSPRVVFDALKSLGLAESENELLRDAVFDSSSELKSVTFSWLKKGNKRHKGMSRTVLGVIEIDGSSLKVSTNSEQRAKKFKQELEARIKIGVRYKATLIEPVEGELEKRWQNRSSANSQSEMSKEKNLSEVPEVKAHLEKIMAEHWKRWVREKVPALGN